MIHNLGIIRSAQEPFGCLDGQGHRKRMSHGWKVQLALQAKQDFAEILQ